MTPMLEAGWVMKCIGDVCDVSAGGTPSTSVDAYWGGNIPWMASGEIHLKRIHDVAKRITDQGYKNSSAKLFPRHTVLVALAGQGKTRGTVAITEIETTTNQSLAGLVTDPKQAEPEYIYYNLDRRYDELRSVSLGGGRGGLNLNILKTLPIVLPPIIEQKKIVAILSTWDSAIDQIGQLITIKRRLKKGLMKKLLSREVRFSRFNTTQWSGRPLEKIADVIMGQSPDSQFYNDARQGLPLIQGNADCVNRKTAPKSFTSQITKETKVGDIIMSVRAPVGTIARSMHNACIGRGVCAIRAKDIDQEYLYQYLLNFESRWDSFAQGSTFTAVNSTDIKKLSVFAPIDKKEQRRIAEILLSIDKEIDLLSSCLDCTQKQKKGLMQKLLTGKVRVRV